MKNTNQDWIELIKYRSEYYNGNVTVEDYISTVVKRINESKLIAEDTVTFMDNIAHILPYKILSNFSSVELNRIIKSDNFLSSIELFFKNYKDVPLEYIKSYKINEAQYHVFQKFLGFKAVENIVDFDKKWYMLVLKRNKNS